MTSRFSTSPFSRALAYSLGLHKLSERDDKAESINCALPEQFKDVMLGYKLSYTLLHCCIRGTTLKSLAIALFPTFLTTDKISCPVLLPWYGLHDQRAVR